MVIFNGTTFLMTAEVECINWSVTTTPVS